MTDPYTPPPSRESQLTREDIKGMHWTEINAALKAGRLNDAMESPDPENDRGYRTKSRVGQGVQGKDFQRIAEANKR